MTPSLLPLYFQCSPCVLVPNILGPAAVGSENYSAGNLPPPARQSHPRPWPTNAKQASAERKIHFSPSLRTCAESQSGTSALRRVRRSAVWAAFGFSEGVGGCWYVGMAGEKPSEPPPGVQRVAEQLSHLLAHSI